MTKKDGYFESEQRAHQYFKDLGFEIEVPKKSLRKGFDFIIHLNYDGEKVSQKVEVKRSIGKDILEPQVKRIKEGALLWIDNKIPKIYTIKDVKFVLNKNITRRFTAKFRKTKNSKP